MVQYHMVQYQFNLQNHLSGLAARGTVNVAMKKVMTLETWLPSDVMSLRLWSHAPKMTALANSFSSALITAFDSQSGKKGVCATCLFKKW